MTDADLARIEELLDGEDCACPHRREQAKGISDAARALLAEVRRLRSALFGQQNEIQQTLGKALGYPWFKDDQVNFPDTTDADGVCIFDHVVETLASEAADTIRELRAMNERAISRLAAACEVLCSVADRREAYTAAELRAKAEELKKCK